MRPNVYLNGELIDRTHEKVIAASSAMRLTFSLVDNPDFTDLLTAKSHITGKTINRFTHIHQSVDDLLKAGADEENLSICRRLYSEMYGSGHDECAFRNNKGH